MKEENKITKKEKAAMKSKKDAGIIKKAARDAMKRHRIATKNIK
jgi:hypothetical protein